MRRQSIRTQTGQTRARSPRLLIASKTSEDLRRSGKSSADTGRTGYGYTSREVERTGAVWSRGRCWKTKQWPHTIARLARDRMPVCARCVPSTAGLSRTGGELEEEGGNLYIVERKRLRKSGRQATSNKQAITVELTSTAASSDNCGRGVRQCGGKAEVAPHREVALVCSLLSEHCLCSKRRGGIKSKKARSGRSDCCFRDAQAHACRRLGWGLLSSQQRASRFSGLSHSGGLIEHFRFLCGEGG